MADFVAPSPSFAPPPDVLGAYIRGQMAPIQVQAGAQQLQQAQQTQSQEAQMFPGQLQGQGLNLQQMRLALQFQQFKQGTIQDSVEGNQGGAQNNGGPTGGIQNGPQGSVAPQSWGGSAPNIGAPMLDPRSAQAVGMLAPDMLKGLTEGRDYALKSAQLQASMPNSPLSVMESFANNPNAHVALMQNPQLFAQWPQLAAKDGVDPSQVTAINVRRVATIEANKQRAALQLPQLPMPEHFNQQGVGYGGTQNVNDMTGQATNALSREVPSGTTQVVTDPDLQQRAVVVPTGGMNERGQPVATGGPASATGTPGAGGAVGGGVPLGMKPPDTENLKAAEFAGYLRGGMSGVNKLESAGYMPSAKARSIIIDAAVNEGEGLTHQYLTQMALGAGLSQQDKTYMSAVMPVMQAAGHAMAGQRLQAGQIRSNFESLIPQPGASADNISQIQLNRKQYYSGLLAQSGSAALLPEYQNTLGADRQRMISDNAKAGAAPASALAYLKANPGKAQQFKAKYGYLPGG